jgi:hypothetical protein
MFYQVYRKTMISCASEGKAMIESSFLPVWFDVADGIVETGAENVEGGAVILASAHDGAIHP